MDTLRIANLGTAVVLIAGSVALAGEGIRALRRGRRQEGQWIIFSGIAMLAMGLVLWVLGSALAGRLIPHGIAGIFFYAMLYCLTQACRSRTKVRCECKISVISVAVGSAANIAVLGGLFVSAEPLPTWALVDPLICTAVGAIVGSEVVRAR